MSPFDFAQLKTIHLNSTDVFVKRYYPGIHTFEKRIDQDGMAKDFAYELVAKMKVHQSKALEAFEDVPADWVSHMLQAFRAKWPRLMPHWMRKRIRLRRIETRVTHRCICPHLPTEETSTHLQWWVSQVEKQDGCNDDVPPVQR